MEEQKSYYGKVKSYYDEDSINFKQRGESNPLLNEIRTSFREESEGISFQNALEIGYGPGFDLVYFAQKHPESMVYGIDISPGMCEVANTAIREAGLNNCKAMVGSVEDLETLLPGVKFDFIYVYFGSLNTVEDLKKAASILKKHLRPEGQMVLTFVNKWYMLGILKPLLKLKFATAFRRLRKTWGGYSLQRFLPSKCYSPTQVRDAFSDFEETGHRGYSILYPAWYEFQKYSDKKELSKKWNWDLRLNKTFMWSWGEYTLFVFRPRN